MWYFSWVLGGGTETGASRRLSVMIALSYAYWLLQERGNVFTLSSAAANRRCTSRGAVDQPCYGGMRSTHEHSV